MAGEANTPETDFGQGGDGPSKEQAQAAQQERAEKNRKEKEQGDYNPEDPRQAGKQYPFARQTQSNPGDEWRMDPLPDYGADDYEGHGRLEGKIALITGGDSGIGRSTAFMFAREGADIAISYLNEDRDAEDTKKIVEAEGRKCILIRGDLEAEAHCLEVVQKTVDSYGRIDVLVNNAAFQGTNIKDISELSRERVERTFNVNIIAMFSITKAAVEHMPPGSCIINLSSVAGFKGSPKILDYAATKGAIRQFTKGLAQMVMPSRGIRVNAVAPGPIWTPIQPSSFSEDAVEELGKGAPEQRAGQPKEVATCIVFLATKESSYVNGEVLTVTGGDPTAS
jgi:hypothetical protein